MIGTVIIVAIAVIFLPDLLNGKKQGEKELFVELPDRPAVKTVQRPASFSTEEVANLASRDIEIVDDKAIDDQLPADEINTATASVSAAQAVPSPEKKEYADKPSTSQALLEGAGWVVQLGTFRDKKNVDELLDKLKKGGYRAFSRPVHTSSGILTKVFVGPDLQKERLDSSVADLTKLTRLKGRVTPFTVQ
nr:SPOR domain-containing protein [Paraglaciecola sp. 20A4]